MPGGRVPHGLMLKTTPKARGWRQCDWLSPRVCLLLGGNRTEGVSYGSFPDPVAPVAEKESTKLFPKVTTRGFLLQKGFSRDKG